MRYVSTRGEAPPLGFGEAMLAGLARDGLVVSAYPRGYLVLGPRIPWLSRLRLLSSKNNSYNRDFGGEDAKGEQMPMMNSFHRDNGVIRHHWGSELLYAPADPGQDARHVADEE